MRPIPSTVCSLLVAAGLVLPSAVFAQDANADAPVAELSGQSSTGAVAANLAAGDANQQANVGLIATGGLASSTGTVAQSMGVRLGAYDRAATASIADDAFAGSAGWIAANVAAGSGNQAANMSVISIGLSGQAVTTALLNQTRAPSQKPLSDGDDLQPGQYSARIGDGAFAESSGLVQLNVVAGDQNTSANVFGLSIAAP